MRRTLPAQTARQLRVINQLVAAVTGSGDDVARQIQAAIAFSRKQRQEASEWARLGQAARRLFDIHTAGRERPCYAHCELDGELIGPLWLQARILRVLRQLDPHRESLLLVTGLKASICPKGQRFTRRRQRLFEQYVAQINRQAAAHCISGRAHVIAF